MDPDRPDPRRGVDPTRRVLWVSFLLALIVYGVLGYTVLSGSRAPSPFPRWLWPTVAAVFALSAFLVPGALAEQVAARVGTSPGIKPQELVGWAFAEAVAIVGLVSVVLGGAREPLAGYLVVAAVILWIRRPAE